MTITVYTFSGAPLPWRVLLGLAFKQLDYDIHTLNFSKAEHQSDEFLKINPRGTVPVLVDGDVVIRDSIACLLWLDRAYPDKPLFGRQVGENAVILQSTFEISDYLRSAQDKALRPVFFGGVDVVTPEHKMAADEFKTEISQLEIKLEGQDFLMGQLPTAADAVAFPEIRILQRGIEMKGAILSDLGFNNLTAEFPNVAAWLDRIEQLPQVTKTFPPHWRE